MISRGGSSNSGPTPLPIVMRWPAAVWPELFCETFVYDYHPRRVRIVPIREHSPTYQRYLEHLKITRRDASGCSSTVLTTLKIAVLAPIPSARDAIAVAVKPGLLRNMRPA